MAKDKLTAKESRFVKEYLIDLNATQAAIRAKYSPDSAANIGSENLRKPHLRQAIQKAMDTRAVRLNVTAERVLSELARLAFSNMGDYMNAEGLKLSELTTDQWAAVQEITEDTTGGSGDGERKLVLRTKFKLADKGLNLERLGRHLKLFTDKLQLNAADEIVAKLIAGRQRASKK